MGIQLGRIRVKKKAAQQCLVDFRKQSTFPTIFSKKVVKTLGPQHQRYSHELIFVVLSTKKRLPVQEEPRKHAPHPVSYGQPEARGGVAGGRVGSVVSENSLADFTSKGASSRQPISNGINSTFPPTGWNNPTSSTARSEAKASLNHSTHWVYVAVPFPHRHKSVLLAVYTEGVWGWVPLF